jgi:hypothetical protein
MVQDTVDDAGAVEPGQHRGPPGDCGRLEPPGLLHPADEQLQVRALRGQRLHATTGAPGHEHVQIRAGVLPGDPLEPCQVRTHGQPQWIGRHNNRAGTHRRGEGSHAPTIRPTRAAPEQPSSRTGQSQSDECGSDVTLWIGLGWPSCQSIGCPAVGSADDRQDLQRRPSEFLVSVD